MLRVKTKSSDAQEKRIAMQLKLSTSTGTAATAGATSPMSTDLPGEAVNDRFLIVSDVVNGCSVYTREYRELTREFHHPDHMS